MSSDPKKLRILKPVAVSALFALVFAAGCGRMSAGELRLQGIEELEAGNYEAASKSFADALDASEGKVGKTQYDILKYRAEVSFKLSDYERAAETWRKLKILDEDPENQSEYDNLIMTCDAAAAWFEALVVDPRPEHVVDEDVLRQCRGPCAAPAQLQGVVHVVQQRRRLAFEDIGGRQGADEQMHQGAAVAVEPADERVGGDRQAAQ